MVTPPRKATQPAGCPDTSARGTSEFLHQLWSGGVPLLVRKRLFPEEGSFFVLYECVGFASPCWYAILGATRSHYRYICGSTHLIFSRLAVPL